MGDFHKSKNRVDEISGIKFITAGSLLAKTSERVSRFDVMNREFNVYEIDVETGILSYTTFIKTQNWEEIKREKVLLPFGKKELKNEKKTDKIISILEQIEDIIHRNHPTEEINLDYMNSYFYTYMRNKEYKKASNQINSKIENAIEKITQMEYRIIKLRAFISFVEKVEPQFNIKVPLMINDYQSSPLYLAVTARRELPSYRRSIFEKIKEQIEDLNFIFINLTSLLSEKGVLLFLTGQQQEESKVLISYLRSYEEEKIKNYLKIDLEETRQFTAEELEKAMIDLYTKIKIEDLDKIYNFLNRIQNDLDQLRRKLIWN
ncbi:MAG: hypothetical protein ACFFDF_17450 [Candidatus Odinarchaeota archaeon]